MSLPVKQPLAPMDALLVEQIPNGHGWQYEPKWDGFRCVVFRDGPKVELQSKSGQPLTRYFPELAAAFLRLEPSSFVLDGEIAVPVKERFSFDDLLQRIHPAESRVQKLSREHPAIFIAFDLLVGPDGKSLLRRRRVAYFRKVRHALIRNEFFKDHHSSHRRVATVPFSACRIFCSEAGFFA